MRIKRGICLSLCAFFICAAAGCGKEEESPEVFLPQEPSAQQEETEWMLHRSMWTWMRMC